MDEDKKISQRQQIVSVGIIPVKKVGDDYKFLLLRVGSWIEFPKGRQEEGESLLETAIRETKEESSIPPESLNFRWGKDSYTTESYKKGKKINIFFLAETDFDDVFLPVNPEIGKAEHDQFMWANYDGAKKLLNDRLGKALDWAMEKIKET
ncbi:MAG: NUDIX domain-containing protein [Patescibacteria group bacterium]